MFRAKGLCVCLTLLLMGSPLSSAEPSTSLDEIKTAVARALPLLMKGAQGHITQRTCFACHNQGVPMLAFITARQRGFPLADDDLKQQMGFISAFLDSNRENYRRGKGQGGQVDTAGYALYALEVAGWKPDATTEAVVEYLLLRDRDVDHWRAVSQRPPSEASDFTTTYLATRAVQKWGTEAQKDRIDKRIATVRGWLLASAARDTEDRVFRLRALHAAGAEDKAVHAAIEELLKGQRDDGGWGQLDTLDSDAYATGSALVALHEAGHLTDDPAYRRGMAFLLKSQRDDGSWHVRSRSKPFQTYYESGFPHGKDQFISMAASAWATTALALACPPAPSSAGPRHQIVVSGKAAGSYAAFPDICRTRTGDLLCVFYSGYGHVSRPNKDWPRGGRVLAVRSPDNGKSWSEPVLLADTEHDDRDPHIAALRDGTLLCTWFVTPHPDRPLPGNRPHAVFLARSTDNGKTWSEPAELKIASPHWFASSAPVRELADGSLILGLYTQDDAGKLAWGATIKSYDAGQTWQDLATIGQDAGLYLDAETDVVPLKDGKLLAALRSSKTDLHFATSSDAGKSWSKVTSSGFKGHCPHFLRHSSGAILLSHRLPATALHWSTDEGKTWQGPLQIDTVNGAYPSCVELPDGRVYCVYYEEGPGSSIRGVRLKVGRSGVTLD